MWKRDLLRVNGWNEQFVGWGYEDTDLVKRLFKAGIYRKDGHFRIPVLHLWHPPAERGRAAHNWSLL